MPCAHGRRQPRHDGASTPDGKAAIPAMSRSAAKPPRAGSHQPPGTQRGHRADFGADALLPLNTKQFFFSSRGSQSQSLLETHYLQIGLYPVNMRTCILPYLVEIKSSHLLTTCKSNSKYFHNIYLLGVTLFVCRSEWINSMTARLRAPALGVLKQFIFVIISKTGFQFSKGRREHSAQGSSSIAFLIPFYLSWF